VTKLSTGQRARKREGVARGHCRNYGRDQGDVILSWLSRIVVVLAITAIIGFDALSIAVAHVSATDDANTAAVAASAAWRNDKGALTPTLLAAQASASQHDETVLPSSLTVESDGTVHLRLQRDATTLVVRHIGPISSWAVVIVKGSGKSDPSS
jgi:hypothetical protein